MISATLTLPKLFALHPQTRSIFNRYGLRGCGGVTGPEESIEFFANAHGVPLDALLRQIELAIHDPQVRVAEEQQLLADARPSWSDAIYRPFFVSAILMMLSMGALWGTLILWKIGTEGSFTGVSVYEINAHGHAQIMGWVGMFIMGFALQAFPRMWQVPLPAPFLAWVTWFIALVAVVVRSTGLYFHDAAWARELHLAGVVLQLAAVGCFVGILFVAFLRSRQNWQPYIGFVFASLMFMCLQAAVSGWHMDRLIGAADRESLLAQIATYQSPLRDLQIHGMALLMIFGVGIRMFPAIFGLPQIQSKRAWLSLGMFLTAIVMEVGLFLTYRATGNHRVAALLLIPWILLFVAAASIVVPWKLWRGLPEPGKFERSGKFLLASFSWLFIAMTMLLLMPIYQLSSAIGFSHAYYGGVRHAITVGFISMMMAGMAAKVVPTLRGVAADVLPGLWLPFTLINVGCFLRVSLQIATDWNPALFKWVGISGMIEWTGFAIWGVHLAFVMFGWGRYGAQRGRHWGAAPMQLDGSEKVAAILDWYPQLEPVFLRYGFHLIRNPVLRSTVACTISLQQACTMKGVELHGMLSALNASISLRVVPLDPVSSNSTQCSPRELQESHH